MSNTSRLDAGDARAHRVSWAKVITSSLAAGVVVVALNVAFAAVAAAFTASPAIPRPKTLVTPRVVLRLAPSLPPAPMLPLLFVLPHSARVATIPLVPSADGIPSVALTAYERATTAERVLSPHCQIPWQLVAAIGYLESDHGQIGGDSLDAQGREVLPVEGIPLDGTNGVALISDGKGGYARAEGPMQFIPSTWAVWGADGNGDHHKDVQNIFDATLAAADYLCSGGANLADLVNQPAAITHYNDSPIYVKNVMNVEAAYAQGLAADTVKLIPMPSPQVCPSPRRRGPHQPTPTASASPTASPGAAPTKCPKPKTHDVDPTVEPTPDLATTPSAPSPTPSSVPTPSPSPTNATGSPSPSPQPSATPTP